MSSAWLAYLPHHVVADLARHPNQLPTEREERLAAVVLFADVAGFTALSEALGRVGRRGTEELTAILNGYFAPMIALVEGYGGIVGKFGGDALTVLFPASDNPVEATRRAVACALAMQAAMNNYSELPTSAGPFSLAMKAGLAAGTLLCTSGGDATIRLEYLIAGAALDRCADAEHHAAEGEVIVHNELLAAGGFTATPVADSFSLVHLLTAPVAPAPLVPLPELPPAAQSTAQRYLHPTVARRVAVEQAGFIDEHRQVSVLFVGFAGPDYRGDPTAGATLRAYLVDVVRLVARYDGFLNKADMGDKGSKLVVLFGAPVAHENDEERALRCALDLRALAASHGPLFETRIGVNSGLVFCGQVGGPTRREYTVMGDAVNLAARLMQAAAPGQILADATMGARSGRLLRSATLPPLTVKGKREAVPIVSIEGLAQAQTLELLEPAVRLPLVGRAQEAERIAELLHAAVAGAGCVIGVSGEAGVGKSRLAAELVGLATASGMRVYGGSCPSYGAAAGYLVWRSIWRGLLGLGDDETVNAERLATTLAAADERLGERGPLLGPLLGVELPANALTGPLDPALRDQLLKASLLEHLRAVATNGPLLLVLDDCHWIDPASRELLAYLGRSLAGLPVALLALYRPPDSVLDPLAELRALPHVAELRLKELDDAGAAQLARLKFAQRFGPSVPAEQTLARLIERAQGNPFYLEELVNLLHDRGLDPADPAALDELALPDTLQNLLVSRIDRLSADEQTVLKTASVIGRRFLASWLAGAAPELGSPALVRRHLQHLSQLDLTPLDRDLPEPEYLFRHALTQEVAYESMAFATRAALHERVGLYLEQSERDGGETQLDVLAYHFGRSHNLDRQRHYFRRAGQQAAATYSNQAALDYYRRLLPLLEPAEQSEVLRLSGEVLRLIGAWTEAEQAAREALSLAEQSDEPVAAANARYLIGAVVSRTRSYDEAQPWLAAALAAFEQHGDLLGQSRTLELLSFAAYQQGDNERANAYAQAHLQVAEMAGDPHARSDALSQLAQIAARRGDRQAALAANREALSLAETTGYRRREVLARSSLAKIHWQQGEYEAALQQLLNGLAVADAISYRHIGGVLVGNAGLIYEYLGDETQAHACYSQALVVAAELGDGPGIVVALSNLALVAFAAGDRAEAQTIGARALELARSLDLPDTTCQQLLLRPRLLSDQGQFAAALPAAREALELAQRLEEPEVVLKARALLLRLRCAVGELATATGVAELEALAAAQSDAHAQADLLYAAQQIDARRDDLRAKAANLYRAAYADAPEVECRRRYHELTDAELPPPPPVPPLPSRFLQQQANLGALLARQGVAPLSAQPSRDLHEADKVVPQDLRSIGP